MNASALRRDVGGWQVRVNDELIARYTASGDWAGKTVAQRAWQMAERDPQRVTHVFEGKDRAIGQLVADAEALAAALQARGFKAGEVIAFQLPNWHEAVLIDLAAAMLGLVVAPIVPIYRDAEVGFMLADCGAKAAFFPGEYRGFDYAAMMQRLAPALPGLRLASMVRGGPRQTDGFESLIGEGLRLRERPNVDANAVKLLLYTSGTTGRPKGVLHSHNTGACTLTRAMRHWNQISGDTILMASPVTHITGFSYGMETPFVGGTCAVFMERWNAIEALDLIDRYQVSASMGATPFLQELIAGAEQHGRSLPSLRLYICGGAEVPPPLIRKAAQTFANCRPFRVYGSSETPLVTLGFVGEGQTDLAAETDGEVVHYEVEIRDDEGRPVPVGQEGEICARGPGMSLGYANPEQSAESFDARGYFATGDLGKLSPEGAVTITGRKKDLINRGGEKVSAKEVEDILHQHPAIAEAAVVSMPHARLGETVCAYVILKPGTNLDLDEVIAAMAQAGVAKQKYPERLEIVDSFPRTASGKIRKDQLRADIRRKVSC